MKTNTRDGFAMLVVVVTTLVLLIMWSSAYREIYSAFAVEGARRDHSKNVDGPLAASARALEKLQANAVPIGSSAWQTTVETASGFSTYKVNYMLNSRDIGPTGCPTNASSCHISVAMAVSGTADDFLPEL
jgi:hypothetical protein